jgi:hypothetical protein
LKHKQERDRKELPVRNRVPDKVAKVNGKKHFGRRQYRLERHIAAIAPGLSFAFYPVFRGAGEI